MYSVKLLYAMIVRILTRRMATASTSGSFRRDCSSFAAIAAFLRALAASAFLDGTRIVGLLFRRVSCSGLEVLNCRVRGTIHCTIFLVILFILEKI